MRSVRLFSRIIRILLGSCEFLAYFVHEGAIWQADKVMLQVRPGFKSVDARSRELHDRGRHADDDR